MRCCTENLELEARSQLQNHATVFRCVGNIEIRVVAIGCACYVFCRLCSVKILSSLYTVSQKQFVVSRSLLQICPTLWCYNNHVCPVNLTVWRCSSLESKTTFTLRRSLRYRQVFAVVYLFELEICLSFVTCECSFCYFTENHSFCYEE